MRSPRCSNGKGPLADASGPWIRAVATELVAVAAGAPFVVQTDSNDVVRRPASLGRDHAQGRGGKGHLGLAQVDVQVFELGATAAAEGPFDAGAGGPSGL